MALKRSIGFPSIITSNEVSKRARVNTTFSFRNGHQVSLSADPTRNNIDTSRTANTVLDYPAINSFAADIVSDNLLDSAANGPLVRPIVFVPGSNPSKLRPRGTIVWFDMDNLGDTPRRSPYYETAQLRPTENSTTTVTSVIVAGVYAETVTLPDNESTQSIAVADYCELITGDDKKLIQGVQYSVFVDGNTESIAKFNLVEMTKMINARVGATTSQIVKLFDFTVLHAPNSSQGTHTVCIHQ
tara:strand:+ start:3066 stop:3794 length:729 start_codon:yes stop_codon:yes gene_type:complete